MTPCQPNVLYRGKFRTSHYLKPSILGRFGVLVQALVAVTGGLQGGRGVLIPTLVEVTGGLQRKIGGISSSTRRGNGAYRGGRGDGREGERQGEGVHWYLDDGQRRNGS